RIHRTILWRDERNAANHAEHLDFVRRASERQADRLLRLMPLFPDAPEIVAQVGDLWLPDRSIACANEHELVEVLRRFGGGLEGMKSSSREEPQRPVTEVCKTCKTNTCGPDITAALARAVTRTKATFRKWEGWGQGGSDFDKERVEGLCRALTSLDGI